MKRSSKSPKVTKGMPSAVLLSILIHAGLFLLAGMLVVFTVVKKEEKKFEPPKAVERPKMKLRKPKVRVKKNAKPKSTTRIVTKINRASMPDIQLPEMSSMGDGFGDMVGGFDMMPVLSESSIFGDTQSIGNDFVGTFYDLKRDRAGRPISYSSSEYVALVQKFIKSGWKLPVLGRYHKSPKKRYTTMFMMPPMISALVPAVFGEPEVEGRYWVTHYKGQLVHKDGITFRFFGYGDGGLAVRVDGEPVLFAGLAEKYCSEIWSSSSADSGKYWLGNKTAVAGDWITLEPGVPLDMEVFMAEGGGVACFMLVVEEKGVEYPMRTAGGPTFPAFKTAEPSRDLLDVIYKSLVPGEVSLTNGPVFADYGMMKTGGINAVQKTDLPEGAVLAEPAPVDPVRTWTSMDGKTMKAKFVVVIGDKVVLETPAGKQRKLLLAQLSAEDREYIELAHPPVFNIDFSAKTEQIFTVAGTGSSGLCYSRSYQAKVKLKQTSAGVYNHELCVEFFAVGAEIHGDRYVLLDRQKSFFTPNKENGRSNEFTGRSVEIQDFEMYGQRRGEKPYGYVITVTDSRGKIIRHKATSEWLYENLENLKGLPLGAYMDKTCTRVFPTGPKRTLY